jgi:hypothetical protein
MFQTTQFQVVEDNSSVPILNYSDLRVNQGAKKLIKTLRSLYRSVITAILCVL